jgi:hypothetical protein
MHDYVDYGLLAASVSEQHIASIFMVKVLLYEEGDKFV